jgi:predicted GTPase
MGYLKLNYVGQANMKQPSEQWNINKHPNNGLLTQEQQKTHCAVKKLPRLVTKELNFTLFQNNKFS